MMSLFAGIAAVWLTGMIPIAAMDACGAFVSTDHATRFAIYWFWPVGLPFALAMRLLGETE
jgi:hypothetical protein